MLLRFLEALIDCFNPVNISFLIIIALFWEKQSISLKKKIAELQEENIHLKDENNHLRKRKK